MDYEKFFNQHYGPIRSFIYKMVLDWHVAEDLTQDVFLSFFRVDKTGKRMDGDINYLYQCARNRVYTHTEKRQRYDRFYKRYSNIDHEEVFIPAAMINEGEHEERNRKRLAWAQKQLQSIKGRCGEVAKSYYIDGLSFDEVSVKFGIKMNLVYRNKNYVIEQVRKKVSKLKY